MPGEGILTFEGGAALAFEGGGELEFEGNTGAATLPENELAYDILTFELAVVPELTRELVVVSELEIELPR